jgi:hypothetical protein
LKKVVLEIHRGKSFIHEKYHVLVKSYYVLPLILITNFVSSLECVKAQIVTFLGKLCLCEKKQAKMIIDILATGFTDDESDIVLCNLLAVILRPTKGLFFN